MGKTICGKDGRLVDVQNLNPSLDRRLAGTYVQHHRIMHFLPLFFGGGSRAATIASSKTSLSLYCVNALHSMYLTAPSSFAIRSPSSRLTGCIFCFESFSLT